LPKRKKERKPCHGTLSKFQKQQEICGRSKVRKREKYMSKSSIAESTNSTYS
jgi:hypothetical protein